MSQQDSSMAAKIETRALRLQSNAAIARHNVAAAEGYWKPWQPC